MSDPLTLTGVSMRQDSFTFEVVDAALTVIGSIEPMDERASIENNMNRTIRRTMSNLVLSPSDAAAINPLSDRIKPYWNINGVAYPLGVFMFGDASSHVSSSGNIMEASMTDLCGTLDQPLEYSVTYNVGTNISDAITTLATDAGVASVSVEASGNQVANAPVTFPAGQKTRLVAMNELAKLNGFYGGYFDNDGTLTFRSVPALGSASPDFDFDASLVVIADTVIQSSDILTAPNRYVVVDSASTTVAVVGSYDIPDAAPHSIVNRGFAVVSVTDVHGITSSDAAADAARALAGQQAFGYQWASLQTIPDPRFDTFDLIYWSGYNWRSQSWNLTLAPGAPMQHEIRRTYDE